MNEVNEVNELFELVYSENYYRFLERLLGSNFTGQVSQNRISQITECLRYGQWQKLY